MVIITHPEQEDTRYVFFNSDGTYDIDDPDGYTDIEAAF